MKIESGEYIEELLANIKRKDFVKARILLRHIKDVDEQTRRRLVFELGRSDDDFSAPLLSSLMADAPDVADKIPELKRALVGKFLDNPGRLAEILADEKVENKLFFIQTAKEITDDRVLEAVHSVLAASADKKTIITAIETIGEIASPSSTNSITEYLYSSDKEICAAAIQALRKIATPAAVQRLAEKLGADRDSDIMILDVFAALQDNLSLEKINMALLSCRAHIRNYAKTKLTEIGKKCVPMLLENLRMEDPDLLIHTLNVLALIGDISAVAPVRKLLFNEPADPNVRFAAYEALGMLPIEKGVHALAGGLLDPVENVRAAAAKAIDRNYSHTLSAGIRNIIKNSASDFHSIVKVIVDSESDNIFKDMLDNDTFKKYALSYIANKAHKDVREHYGKFFKAAGDQAAADAILRTAAPKETKEQAPKHKCPFRRVYIVDDSKMILSVYKNVLHEMSCDPELFDTPRAVIERIAKQAPDLLVTDLNMPDMTGIELTAAVRKQYPPKDLPIIMVTTQHETQDNEAAYSAGVDIVMHKPFTADSLAQAFDSVSQKWKR